MRIYIYVMSHLSNTYVDAYDFLLLNGRDATEPEQGVFTFDQADQVASFAVEHGMKLRGHTFVWHRYDSLHFSHLTKSLIKLLFLSVAVVSMIINYRYSIVVISLSNGMHVYVANSQIGYPPWKATHSSAR